MAYSFYRHMVISGQDIATSTYQKNKHYKAFLHDVTAATLVFENNETAAMSVYQENPLGV